jgi:hypothetical protein
MKYDVCLSYASEDGEYVAAVAEALRAHKVRVFYDRFETAKMWGKNLYTYLGEIYQDQARFCVMFISESYASKRWTKRERESAQSRAFAEDVEYILPARFDDALIPGLLQTVAHVDLRTLTPQAVGDLIYDKLQDSLFESDGSPERPGIEWMGGTSLTVDGQAASLRTFQRIPIGVDAPNLEALVSRRVADIAGRACSEPGRVYWPHGQDRRFDRIYATTSVLYSLCQLGVPHDLPLIRRAIDGLIADVGPTIEDRAGVIFLTMIGEVPHDVLLGFLRELARVQHTSETNRRASGSFLLPQGPVTGAGGRMENWNNIHRDGASFHACHIADALLHIPEDFTECRAVAEPMLDGIRAYLTRSFVENDGWLLDLEGEVTPLTLYGYALCRPLGIQLPKDWRTVSEQCHELATAGTHSILKRFFGVMNAAYAARSVADHEFDQQASGFISSQLAVLPTSGDLDSLGVVDLAAFLRSIAYGVAWLDHRFMPALTIPATVAVSNWTGEGS